MLQKCSHAIFTDEPSTWKGFPLGRHLARLGGPGTPLSALESCYYCQGLAAGTCDQMGAIKSIARLLLNLTLIASGLCTAR